MSASSDQYNHKKKKKRRQITNKFVECEHKLSLEMEMDTTEWDAICRICLQEGQMYSIFDYDDDKSDISIAKKISMCSSIEVFTHANE